MRLALEQGGVRDDLRATDVAVVVIIEVVQFFAVGAQRPKRAG